LDHYRGKEREYLFVEIITYEFPVERLGFVVLVDKYIVSVKLRHYHVRKDTVVFLLLAVNLLIDCREDFKGLLHRFFLKVPLRDIAAVLGHTYLIEFFQVGGINRKEFDPLEDRKGGVFRFQQDAVIK
jgi:hypothetical protein